MRLSHYSPGVRDSSAGVRNYRRATFRLVPVLCKIPCRGSKAKSTLSFVMKAYCVSALLQLNYPIDARLKAEHVILARHLPDPTRQFQLE